jgi:eukaryotic-like serine/threonine-protein kinase
MAQRRHVSGPLATAVAPEPGLGDLLGGRYRIDSELGYGGMAHVYRARDELLQRDVAVKVFRSNVSEAVDPKRTTREMHILASLSHPAVVSVLDASDDPQSGAYIVMELVDGDDLGTALRAGPLPAEQARRIAGDVAGALDALHARGVVHRDVKPANILVLAAAAAASGGVAAKLTDFGIAQLVDSSRITGPESMLGTAAFLSPEQVRGERVTPAADVYSLGLVLLECLTGQRVFPGSGVETAVVRLTRAPVIPASLSTGLGDLLRRMTAVDPGTRPTAGEVAEQLQQHLAGGMLAGEDALTAQTPAIPMAAVAAASMPLATGPVRATGGVPTAGWGTGAVPTGSSARPGTGGIGTAFPDAVAVGPEDPARRRRRLGMLSALIGAFAALTATAAILVAVLPGPAASVAPVERQGGSASPSASAPVSSPATSTRPSSGRSTSTGSASVSASPTGSASSGSGRSSTASASTSPSAGPSSPSGTPTAGSSSGTASSTPSGQASSAPATTRPTTGTTSSASASETPSSGSSESSTSDPTGTLGILPGDGTDGADG